MSLPEEREWLRYKCTADGNCGQLFITWGALKVHQSYTHHDRRAWSTSYTCSLCQKEFETAADVQSHAATHFTGKTAEPGQSDNGRQASRVSNISSTLKSTVAQKPVNNKSAPKGSLEAHSLQSVVTTRRMARSATALLDTHMTSSESSEPVPHEGREQADVQNTSSESSAMLLKTFEQIGSKQAVSAPARKNVSVVSSKPGQFNTQALQNGEGKTDTFKQTSGMTISVVVQKTGNADTAQSILQHLASGGTVQDSCKRRAPSSDSEARSSKMVIAKKDDLTEKEKSNLEHYPAAGGRTGIYICKSCGQVFVSMSRFREHLSTHSNDVKVACRHCGKYFYNHEALASHAASHTQQNACTKEHLMEENEASSSKSTGSSQQGQSGIMQEQYTEAENSTAKDYSCPACNESFDSMSALNRHTATHKDITFFQCATCEQLFVSREAFSDHLQSQCLPPKADRLTCDSCASPFTSSAELSKHKCHKLKAGSDKSPSEGNSSGKYLCADCGILFRAERPYVTHLIKHAVNKAKGIEQNELECQECKLVCTSKRALRRHMQGHNWYPCKKCDAVYDSKRALVSHQKKHVTEPDSSTFSCQFCDLNFLNRQELNLHIRTDHADHRPYACDLCDASFKAKFDLKRHKLKHEGKKFYVCKYCCRDFYAKKDLDQHEAAVHSLYPRTKPFMCHECGKVFYTRGHLNTHRRSHSTDKPFACPECPVRCKTKKNLDVHMRRHRGELPIKCGVCGMGFVDHCYLTRHLARHKPAPDLHCHLCHKAFYHRQHLKSHVSTIHFICFNCDETFTCKRDIKMHRPDCPFPGAARYLRRPGVMSTPSAVVVEPVNPGGNMLVSRSVEGSSNFADTLAPTTGPDAKDSLLTVENTAEVLTTSEGDVHSSPFGHYNADTNTVIIYEDQLRWAKNAVDPSGSGPCTFEINIPGENSGEVTKLIIEDKTGDTFTENAFEDLSVPDISQEEVVTASDKTGMTADKKKTGKGGSRKKEKKQVTNEEVGSVTVGDRSDAEPITQTQTFSDPVRTVSLAEGIEKAAEKVVTASDKTGMTADKKKTGKGSSCKEKKQVTTAEVGSVTVGDRSDTEPITQTQASSDPVSTVSLAEGIEKAAEKAGIKDARVVLVDVKETLRKLAGEEAAELFTETAGFVTMQSNMDSSAVKQPEGILFESDRVSDLEQFEKQSTSEVVVSEVPHDHNDALSMDVVSDEMQAGVQSCCDIDQQSSCEMISSNTEQAKVVSSTVVDPEKSEQDSNNEPGQKVNQVADSRTLFKCRHCERIFATRIGAITHSCPSVDDKSDSQSRLNFDHSSVLTSSTSLPVAAPSSVNIASTPSDTSAGVKGNNIKNNQSGIVVSASASGASVVSPAVHQVMIPPLTKSAKPQAITISSGSAASKLLSTSVSLLYPGQTSGSQSLLVSGQGIQSKKAEQTGFHSEIVSTIVTTSVTTASTGASTLSSNSSTLVSSFGNVIRLAPHSTSTKPLTDSFATIARELSKTGLQAQASDLTPRAPIPLQSKTGTAKFKCFHCGELFPTIEDVIVHARTHAPVSADSFTSTAGVAGAGNASKPVQMTVLSPGVSPLTLPVTASVRNSQEDRSVQLNTPSSSTVTKTQNTATSSGVSSSALISAVPAISASGSSGNRTAESVLISLPASSALEKTRVIALPGKSKDVTKHMSGSIQSPMPRVSSATIVQPVDVPSKSLVGKKTVSVSVDVGLSPVPPLPASVSNALEQTSTSDSALPQSEVLIQNVETADVNTGPPLLSADEMEAFAPSVDNLSHAEDYTPQSKHTKAVDNATRGAESTKEPQNKIPEATEQMTDISEQTTPSIDKAAAKNIFFQCNDCGDCFTTVAAFAQHAKHSHPKPVPKLHRPGRRKSTWKKHREEWDELEKTTLSNQAEKHNTSPKLGQKRKRSLRSTQKNLSTPVKTMDKAAAGTGSKGKCQVGETKIHTVKKTVTEEVLPEESHQTEPKRARMSVLELAAAAEVVEDTMWQLDRPYQCDICEASFSSLQQVQQHLTSLHQRQEVYQCSHCVGVFSSLANLTLHFKKHAQLMAEKSTSISQQNGNKADAGGMQIDAQEQGTPRRRTRSRSSSAKGRLSSSGEPSDSSTSNSTQRDKEGSRYSRGLTLESLADAAVALAERGGRMNVSTSPPAKTMWEACYSIGDQTFTISVAVPAPTKTSPQQLDTGLKEQRDRSHGAVDAQDTQGGMNTFSAEDSQKKCSLQGKDATSANLSNDDGNFMSTVSESDLQTVSNSREISKMKLTRQRLSRPVGENNASAFRKTSVPHLEGEDPPPEEDSSDSDVVSIWSADEGDEDLPVLSLDSNQSQGKAGSPSKIKTPVKAEAEKSYMPDDSGSLKRGRRPEKSPQRQKSRRISAQHSGLSGTSANDNTGSSTQTNTRKTAENIAPPSGRATQKRGRARSASVPDEIESSKQRTVPSHDNSSYKLPPSGPTSMSPTPPLNSRESSFRCEVCHEMLTSKSLLDEHVLTHRSSQGTYSCTSCQRGFRSYAHLVTHLLQHVAGLPFHCGLCTAAFNHYAALHAHQRTHNLSQQPKKNRILCTLCGSFIAKSMYAQHQKSHSSEPEIAVHSVDGMETEEPKQAGKEETGKVQGSSSMSDVEAEVDDECLKTDDVSRDDSVVINFDDSVELNDKSTLDSEQSVSDSKTENHSVFDDIFLQLPDFSEHFDQDISSTTPSRQATRNQNRQTSSTLKPSCPVCERSFCNSRYLQIHMKSHDTGSSDGKPTCTVCGKTFSHAAALQAHEKRHAQGLAFSCSMCSKSYRDKYTLQQHEKTHEGKSTCRYTCPVCEHQFNNLHDMEYHREGHNTSAERRRPFICSTCGKAFARQSYLNMHTKRHKGPQFTCFLCDKVLTSKRALEEHMRSHLGEKPFKCEICDSTFVSKKQLERHSFLHSGKAPFLCQLCGKGFLGKEKLAEHEASHVCKDNKSKSYVCSVCDKKLKTKSGFVTHTKLAHKRLGDSTE